MSKLSGVCLFLIVTPPEYQPPGFKEGESEFILFEGIPVHVKVGEIETSFHVLKLKIIKKEERIDSMDIHGILKECREDAEREKEQTLDPLGEYINREYEPPGSEDEFVDKYHKKKQFKKIPPMVKSSGRPARTAVGKR
ncbi:HORMA domain containing 1 [Chelydra serpentina]|uniref:HORMA domain containing 1 n=1 Tax=Chelydra serpentina TaxID=8475 RepID=A0A8T1SH87_CHESE|nr:HORMA domain containing 1 [Chelydra serpentina]